MWREFRRVAGGSERRPEGLGVMADGESTQNEEGVAGPGTAGSAFSHEELETLIAEAVARALASRSGESPGKSSVERGG